MFTKIKNHIRELQYRREKHQELLKNNEKFAQLMRTNKAILEDAKVKK